MMKRTDVSLSAGTLGLALVAMMVVAFTGSTGEFVAWAWERHHNVLSWYIRVLFLLPFCYFAYKRSLFGMVLTLVALATSMFWVPAPERPDARVRVVVPSCYGADRRSLFGRGLTLVARATSMFWFPAPERPNPRVLEFLAI